MLEFKEVRSLGRVIEVINGSAGEGEVGICSFDAELLMKVRDVKAGIRLGLIVDAPPENPEVVLATLGCEVMGVRFLHITRELVERVQAIGDEGFWVGGGGPEGSKYVIGVGVGVGGGWGGVGFSGCGEGDFGGGMGERGMWTLFLEG